MQGESPLPIMSEQQGTGAVEDEVDIYYSTAAKRVKILPKRDQIRIRIELERLIGEAELNMT